MGWQLLDAEMCLCDQSCVSIPVLPADGIWIICSSPMPGTRCAENVPQAAPQAAIHQLGPAPLCWGWDGESSSGKSSGKSFPKLRVLIWIFTRQLWGFRFCGVTEPSSSSSAADPCPGAPWELLQPQSRGVAEMWGWAQPWGHSAEPLCPVLARGCARAAGLGWDLS